MKWPIHMILKIRVNDTDKLFAHNTLLNNKTKTSIY